MLRFCHQRRKCVANAWFLSRSEAFAAMRGSSRITLKLVPDCGDEAVSSSSSSTILASFRLDAGSSEAAEEDAGGGIEQVVRCCCARTSGPSMPVTRMFSFHCEKLSHSRSLRSDGPRARHRRLPSQRRARCSGGEPDEDEDGSVSSRDLDKVRLPFVFIVVLFG
jgi:hypothetical protein